MDGRLTPQWPKTRKEEPAQFEANPSDAANFTRFILTLDFQRTACQIYAMADTFTKQLRVIHKTPGRIRISVPFLHGRASGAADLARHLGFIPHDR